MDIEDISPAAVILALLAAVIVIAMMTITNRNPDVTIGLFWRILSPICAFAASFFVVQRMADN